MAQCTLRTPRICEHHARRLRRPPSILAFALALGGLAFGSAWSASPAPTAQVQVASLQRGTLHETTRAWGSISAGTGQGLAINFPQSVDVARVFVRAGEHVQHGQPLVAVRAAPETALAQARARAAVRFAEADLARIRALQARQLATRSQVDAAAKALADAKAQLTAAADRTLGQADATRTAPFDGVVTALNTTAGARLAAGNAALELVPTAHAEAVVGVSPEIAQSLHAGQAATLRAVFGGAAPATATVRAVGGMVDPRSHLVDVVLAPGARAAAWLPGTPVEASFALDAWTGWVVPRQAVLRDARGQAYVFQDDHGRARRVNVALAIDTSTRSGIAGPLAPTLPLVVLGNAELDDGMALGVGR